MAKTCKKCNSTNFVPVNRKQKNGKIYITSKCLDCALLYQRTNKTVQKWFEKNREHLREYQRKYYAPKHKERNGINAKCLRERTININEKPAIAEFYNNRPKGYHVDHIVPLNGKNVNGLHTLSNLQYLPAKKNLRKSNKT